MTISDQVLEALAAIVGRKWLRLSNAELETFSSDALPTLKSRPGAVVLPDTRDQIVSIARLLAHHRIPMVARGAGTGLSGGALAASDALLVTLTRMTRIIEVDQLNRRAVVEPGVVNTQLSQAVAPFGLHYAPDPSSQTACTIGGNVAENAGGPHCLKYGVTTNHVLELEVVLANGEIALLGSPNGEPWGPDLVGLFVGSEGTFGIATRITVRLTPTPVAVRTLLADFSTIRAAGEAVSAIIAEGIVPAALEMMDRNCVSVVESSIYSAGYPTDAAAVLLVELDGIAEQPVEDGADAIERILRSHGARTVRLARTASERDRLWQGRKKAFGALGRFSSALAVQDAVVPRSTLPEVLDRIDAIAKRYQLTVSNVFHAGDGNLHPNISYDRTDPAQRAKVERASAEIMDVCIAAGGTITGEHGVGRDKIRHMTRVFDGVTLNAMRETRRAFDGLELANPGKVIPIHACKEWRAGGRANRAHAS